MQRHLRNLAVVAVAVGLLSGAAPLLGVAAGTTATTTSPARYTQQVCASLATWLEAVKFDDPSREHALTTSQRPPKSTRRAMVALLASDLKASETLFTSTKAVGTPSVPDGQQIATDYLQMLGDIRDAFSAARTAATRAPVTSKKALAASVTTIFGNLAGPLEPIGDPFSTLNPDPTVAAAIQADAGCAPLVAGFNAGTFSSGLQTGDCITADEQKVDCTTPHDGEVMEVTSYPADSSAPYPGNDALNAFANQTCAAAFAQYVGVPVEQATEDYAFFDPSPGADWNSGNREIVCEATNDDGTPLTGSLKGQAS